MRITVPSAGDVPTDVEVDDGVTVAALRRRLARLTGDTRWAAGTPTADGEPLSDAHPAGVPPLCHGATLRPGPGPVPDAVRAARADLHVAVVAGPDTGALLVPEGAATLGPSGALAVADAGGWLVEVRPAGRGEGGRRGPRGYGGSGAWPARLGGGGTWAARLGRGGTRPARRGRGGAWSSALLGGAWPAQQGGNGARRARRRRGGLRVRRMAAGAEPPVLVGRRWPRRRRVPRWRWARWRVGDELRAGASALVLRAGPGADDEAADRSDGTASQGDAAPLARPARAGRWTTGRSPLARMRHLAPALAGAATSVALAASLRQPALLLGAVGALAVVGTRPPPVPGGASHGVPPGSVDDETTGGWRDEAAVDLAALRVALASSAAGVSGRGAGVSGRGAGVSGLDAGASARGGSVPTPGLGGPMHGSGGAMRAVPGAPRQAPRMASPVPWDGDLAVVGPRPAALAAARGLLLAALGPDRGPAVALATDRPGDWAWLAWCRDVSLGPPTPGDEDALVVLDGPAAGATWHAGRRVLRLPGASAPAWCRSVLEVDGRSAVLRTGGRRRPVPFVGVGAEVAEAVVRAGGSSRAAPMSDPSGVLDGCPRDVALGALAGVPAPDPRAVARAWRAERARRRPVAPVPIGLGAGGAPVAVDLVVDGPHALVAGTTGSGKSELLTTLVLALALAHPPDRLAVLLVDFKGGTGLPALAGLPHVVGRLSDLDAAGAARTVRGLFAELRRRERVLAGRGARDVRDLDPVHPATPPRLVVVIDEFRALADELPDLLPGLARLAAQGRSLGVHLVLATQRPAGAVPTDLRANVALRVVLRVADAADSLDLVGVPDAASFDRPGLALLARGAGRPEPVQVARALPRASPPVRLAAPWPAGFATPRPAGSAAPRPEGRADGSPAAGHGWRDGATRRPDDGPAAWVAAAATAAAGLPRATGPWLPPLPERVRAADVPPGPGLPLALADLPDDLARGPVRWDPDGGHLLVVGGPGSGRSTALAAVAAAALASGRPVHAVGLPPDLLPAHVAGALGTALDGTDVTRVARLVRLLAGTASGGPVAAGLAPAGPTSADPRPLLVLDDVAAVLDGLAGVARGRAAELLTGLWATAGGPVAVVAATGLDAGVGRLVPAFADRLVLGSPDPSADLLAGVPADLAGPRTVPGRAVHLGRGGAALCQVALPDEAAGAGATAGAAGGAAGGGSDGAGGGRSRGGTPLPRRGPSVRPLPRWAVRPAVRRLAGGAAAGAGLALGLGGDDAGVVRVGVDRPLFVVGPPGSGRTTALGVLAAAARGAGLRVRHLAGGDDDVAAPGAGAADHVDLGAAPRDPLGAGPGNLPGARPEDLLVVDDLDELEARHPAVADALAGRLAAGAPPPRLLIATTTAHAASAFRGPAPALVRGRRVLVLDPAEPGSLDLLGPEGAWLVDPRGHPPGRGALRIGREVTPVQVFAP